MVKNLPAYAGDVETWIRFLGLEDPLEESMAAHFSVLPWRIHRGASRVTVHGVTKSRTQLKRLTTHSQST